MLDSVLASLFFWAICVSYLQKRPAVGDWQPGGQRPEDQLDPLHENPAPRGDHCAHLPQICWSVPVHDEAFPFREFPARIRILCLLLIIIINNNLFPSGTVIQYLTRLIRFYSITKARRKLETVSFFFFLYKKTITKWLRLSYLLLCGIET